MMGTIAERIPRAISVKKKNGSKLEAVLQCLANVYFSRHSLSNLPPPAIAPQVQVSQLVELPQQIQSQRAKGPKGPSRAQLYEMIIQRSQGAKESHSSRLARRVTTASPNRATTTGRPRRIAGEKMQGDGGSLAT